MTQLTPCLYIKSRLARPLAGLTRPPGSPPCLGPKGFAVPGPLALLGSAFYAILVHQLTIYAPRFLPTLGHSHAVALHFAHCDQLAAGLAPAGVRPSWAHHKKNPLRCRSGFLASFNRMLAISQRHDQKEWLTPRSKPVAVPEVTADSLLRATVVYR